MVIYVIIVWALVLLIPILFLLYLKFTSPETPTTTNKTLKNREGYVIKEIQPENISGKVKIVNSSKVWSATAKRRIEEGKRVIINEVEGVHIKVEETVDPDADLIDFEGDWDEQEVCPTCETVITVYTKECPVCGEKIERKEKSEKGRFFKFFDDIFGSLRG
ncbi:MAG: NfeD family protein [Candidatus Natronoplasma sp.]